MGSLFVGLGGIFVAVDFIQDEPQRIIGLLKHVKSQIARLQDGASSVFLRGRDEILKMPGLTST